MSDAYIARQPIFDKNMAIFGYKLFYHKDFDFFNEKENDDKSTASLIDNVLLTEFENLTDGARGFIKVTKNLLFREAPFLFPSKNTVVELPGDIQISDYTLDACRKLKDKGYVIALDGLDIKKWDKIKPLLPCLDIIKIDFSASDVKLQADFLRTHKKKPVFLAMKVETRQQFEKAKSIGYKLFQGAFYSKPVALSAKSIGSFQENLIFILNELYKDEPNVDIIASAFERDIELSYKLLRMANSAFYGMRYHTDSLRMALIQLGTNELIRWVNVMMIKGVQNPENAELIKVSIIRGKMLALLAIITDNRSQESNYLITGMFSSIDVLLGQDMKTIVAKLPLGEIVCRTLLGEDTPIRRALDVVVEYEKGNWDDIDAYLKEIDINQEAFISLYVDAIKWQKTF